MYRSGVPGFSLPELLIALSIVAILASITVPSYSGYVARSRRVDAMAVLLQLQLAQLRWRAHHGEYSADLDELGYAGGSSPGGHYRLRLQREAGGDFLLLAVPAGAQRGDACGTFALSSEGPVYGGGYAGASCWNR